MLSQKHTKMNKLGTIALLGVLALASLTSCTKEEDGADASNKKIQKVYVSTTDTEKYLSQSWDWDGNLLKAINHYNSDGSLFWTETFTYEEGRLVRVDDSNGPEYTIYDYDGEKLKSANYYIGNALETTATYSYLDGKLNKIVLTTDEDAKSVAGRNLIPSVLPFSTELLKVIEEVRSNMTERSSGKDAFVMELQLTWSGDNVSTIVATHEEETETVMLQYDSKNNPYMDFLGVYSFDLDEEIQKGYLFMSKNNITNVIFSGYDGTLSANFTYQYDGDDYPTTMVRTWVDAPYVQYTAYYEYQ